MDYISAIITCSVPKDTNVWDAAQTLYKRMESIAWAGNVGVDERGMLTVTFTHQFHGEPYEQHIRAAERGTLNMLEDAKLDSRVMFSQCGPCRVSRAMGDILMGDEVVCEDGTRGVVSSLEGENYIVGGKPHYFMKVKLAS
jgi:hypothetical protein